MRGWSVWLKFATHTKCSAMRDTKKNFNKCEEVNEISQTKSPWMNQPLRVLPYTVSLVVLVHYWLPHPIISLCPHGGKFQTSHLIAFKHIHLLWQCDDQIQSRGVWLCVFSQAKALIHLQADGCNWSHSAVSLCYWSWQLYTSTPVPQRDMLKC